MYRYYSSFSVLRGLLASLQGLPSAPPLLARCLRSASLGLFSRPSFFSFFLIRDGLVSVPFPSCPRSLSPLAFRDLFLPSITPLSVGFAPPTCPLLSLRCCGQSFEGHSPAFPSRLTEGTRYQILCPAPFVLLRKRLPTRIETRGGYSHLISS
ncbi:uncharacterized protein BJX67DRAFT_48524 [Aspergillus lucknowensis]|uniref:Transmembrane protein n=1 Tax=Aspergillus lucknowensis TaxID=176173 RepID=A0ABR4LVU4_9EURO